MNDAQPEIALVEDNADNRVLVRAMIGGDYDIAEYETGPEALEGIPDDPPDLILMDISLPEMNGVEVLRKLRESPDVSPVPAVALTAHAMSGDRERYLEAGFDGYMSKPIVDDQAFRELVENTLTGSEG